jgi:hypothetical protein
MTKIRPEWGEDNFPENNTWIDRLNEFDHEYSNQRNRPRLYATGGFTMVVAGVAIRAVDSFASINNGNIYTASNVIEGLGGGAIMLAGALKLDLYIGDLIPKIVPKIKSRFAKSTQSEASQSDQV